MTQRIQNRLRYLYHKAKHHSDRKFELYDRINELEARLHSVERQCTVLRREQSRAGTQSFAISQLIDLDGPSLINLDSNSFSTARQVLAPIQVRTSTPMQNDK